MFKSGKAVIPSNGSGTAPDAASSPGGIEVSFDAGLNKLRQATLGVLVTNREASGGNTLEISFSNGSSWFAIATDTTIVFPTVIHRVRLRGSSGATADYSIMGIV